MPYTPSFADVRDFTNNLHTFISSRGFAYKGGLFKVAMILHNGILQFGEGCLLFQSERKVAAPKADYGEVVFLEEWVEPLSEAENFLPPFLSGQRSIAGQKIKTQFTKTESEHRNSIHFSTTGWQEWVFRTRADFVDRPDNPIQLSQNPPTRKGLPPYFTPAHAIAERIEGIRKWQSISSPWFGQFTTILPETRARLLSGEWAPGNIHIEIESNISFASLELQLILEFHDCRQSVILPLTNQKIDYEISLAAKNVELFLVDEFGECLSRARLSSVFEAFGPDKPEQEFYQRTLSEVVNGESQQVEYKSFVEPKNVKEREIIRTIVAFANTSGGRLYLGVENDGSLQGQADLCAAYRTSFEKAQKALISRIQNLIVENVKPVPGFKIDFVEVRGQPIFVISVEKGSQKPYSNRSHEVWIRKGANDFVPDPRTEFPTGV